MASKDTFTAEVPNEIEEDPGFKDWSEKADGKKTLLILGSGKGKEQDKAIKKSKELLKGYKVDRSSIVKKD